jgi:UDP-3-O-acyl-N-acetylglucosamine deacetylase
MVCDSGGSVRVALMMGRGRVISEGGLRWKMEKVRNESRKILSTGGYQSLAAAFLRSESS